MLVPLWGCAGVGAADGVDAVSSSAPALRIAVATSVGTASRRGARVVARREGCRDVDLDADRRLTVGAVTILDPVICHVR